MKSFFRPNFRSLFYPFALHLSFSLSTHQPIQPSTHLPHHPSIHLTAYPFNQQSTHPPNLSHIHQNIHLSIQILLDTSWHEMFNLTQTYVALFSYQLAASCSKLQHGIICCKYYCLHSFSLFTAVHTGLLSAGLYWPYCWSANIDDELECEV